MQSSLNNPNDDLLKFLDKKFEKNSAKNIITEIQDNKVNATYEELEGVRKTIEQQISIFDDKNSNTIDLKDRNDYIRKNFDLEVFLKSQKRETTKLLTNEDLFFNMDNENMCFFLTVIREKVHQIYLDFTKPIEKKILIANDIINKRICLPHPTKHEIYGLFTDYLKNQAQIFFEYLYKLPGLNSFCQHDFTTILDHNLSLIHAFRVVKLFIGNENFIIIRNYHFNKNSLYELFGPIAGDLIVNFLRKLNQLNLKNEELSLLIPFVLTSIGN